MTTFSTWGAVRTAIKNAIATHADGDPCIGEYSVEGVTVKYTSVTDLENLYKMTFRMEALDSTPTRSSRTSVGSHRRFQ